MKYYWREYKEGILIALAIWFFFGFLTGSFETMDMRNRMRAVNYTDKDGKSQYKYVDDHRSGCVYESIFAFVNIGHVAACELFRARFDIEGFGQHK